MESLNNEEFIHAIFAQMCSSRPIQERLKDDFNLPIYNLHRKEMMIEDLKPIIIEEEINNCSLKKRDKIKKNRSQKKRSK